MAVRAESRKSVLDTVKLILAVLFVLVGVVGFYYFSAWALSYRVLAVVGFSIVSVTIVLSTGIGKDFLVFLKDARVEVRKVVWPTRQETMQATLVVIALVFLVGLILWLLDMGLFWLITLLTGQGA